MRSTTPPCQASMRTWLSVKTLTQKLEVLFENAKRTFSLPYNLALDYLCDKLENILSRKILDFQNLRNAILRHSGGNLLSLQLIVLFVKRSWHFTLTGRFPPPRFFSSALVCKNFFRVFWLAWIIFFYFYHLHPQSLFLWSVPKQNYQRIAILDVDFRNCKLLE